MVDTGPVKEDIVKGDAIDQTEFPVPKWHFLEGGRYIHTFSSHRDARPGHAGA